MANRYTNQFRAQLEKRCNSIFMHVSFGAAGAPTLDVPNSKGIVSITRNSAGLYTVVFGTNSKSLDAYVKLLCINKIFFEASGTSDRQTVLRANNISNNNLASLQIEFDNPNGTASDPDNGSQVYMEFIFGDSTAP